MVVEKSIDDLEFVVVLKMEILTELSVIIVILLVLVAVLVDVIVEFLFS